MDKKKVILFSIIGATVLITVTVIIIILGLNAPVTPVSGDETQPTSLETQSSTQGEEKKIEFEVDKLSLELGMEDKLKINTFNVDEYIFELSKEDIIEIDNDGNIKALNIGVVNLKCVDKIDNTIYDTLSVTVYEAVTSLEFEEKEVNLKSGEEITLNVKILPQETSLDAVVFESSNENIVEVDQSGKIKALSQGTATIKVTSLSGNIYATCEVKVQDEITEFKLNKSKLSLAINQAYTFEVTANIETSNDNFNWTTSDESIAQVDENGKVTGVSQGSATITSVSKDKEELVQTCIVTVENKVTEISLDVYQLELEVDESEKINYTVYPDNATNKNVSFTSSDKNVATVDDEGNVYATGVGEAYITCKSTDNENAYATCFVKVLNKGAIVDYYTAYTSYEVTNDCIELAREYPEIISYQVIGSSTKGKDIPMITLGTGSKKGLVGAGIHSREHLSISVTMAMVEDYAVAYYSNSGMYDGYNMRDLLSTYTLYIVPVINPDGLDIFTNGESLLYDYPNFSNELLEFKGNANGVNLNRNFPFTWEEITNGSISSRTTTLQKYIGQSAGSEAETQVMMNLCYQYDFEWMMSMHLRGDCLYWRDNENGSVSGDYELASALQNVCGYTMYPASTQPNEYGGGFENWFRQEFNKPGICVELVESHISTPTRIDSYNKDFYNASDWENKKYTFIQGMLQ